MPHVRLCAQDAVGEKGEVKMIASRVQTVRGTATESLIVEVVNGTVQGERSLT